MTAESESVVEIVALTRAVTARRRVRRAMVLGLVLSLVFGPYLFFRICSFSERVKIVRLQSTEKGTDSFDGQLTVAIWNIAHGRGNVTSNWEEPPEPKVARVMEIALFIKKLDADIVVLNEVDFTSTWSGGFDQAHAIAKAAGFPYYAKQCNLDFGFLFGRWQFGNVILSRFPITSVTAIDLPPHKEWEDWLVGRKRGLLCTVELRPGIRINVVGLHLETRSAATRVKSVEFLADLFSSLKGPIIVGGDLNTTPSGAPQSNHTPSGENAFDNLIQTTGLQSDPMRIYDASQLTFPSWKPATAIDWILFSPDDWQPVAQKVLQSDLSDHLPVVANLRLTR